MSQKADMTFVTFKPGMVSAVHSRWRSGLVDVRIDDACPIEIDGNLSAVGDYFFKIPLTDGL